MLATKWMSTPPLWSAMAALQGEDAVGALLGGALRSVKSLRPRFLVQCRFFGDEVAHVGDVEDLVDAPSALAWNSTA